MSNKNITDQLNTLLADYMVYYQKLRNYHWNVKGHEFFKLHEKFEEGYLETAEWADDIAERILAVDGQPYATLAEFVDHARIDEDTDAPHWRAMVQNLVADIEQLNQQSVALIRAAEDAGDRTTVNVLDEILDAQEERKWMFRTFLQD